MSFINLAQPGKLEIMTTATIGLVYSAQHYRV